MNAQDIRRAYLDFFKERGHTVIPRASLVPVGDPTTLFTGSGMQPLIPYLLGEAHPKGTRLVDSQTCLRAQDIEEVGDNRHTTFFEMLGNWSLGDYFKEEQIPWFFEFLTKEVGLDPERIFVTCFIGDEKNDIPKDEQSADIWERLFNETGISSTKADIGSEADGYKRGIKDGERIFFYDASKNWWCRAGKIDDMPEGEPGGGDTEVFYLYPSVRHNESYGPNCHPNCDCGRYIELGNSVFMEYVKTAGGFEKLPKQNVDYGGGLERIAAAVIDSPDVFKISLLWPIIEKLSEISGKTYESHTNSMRVIADHLRGAVFLAVDGVTPSNKEQGYVMRRLVRRAMRFAFDLGIEQDFLEHIVPVVADIYHDDFPEIAKKRSEIIDVLLKEEKLFRQTLRNGISQLQKLIRHEQEDFAKGFEKYKNTEGVSKGIGGGNEATLTGDIIFTLYDTYGFPVELTLEEGFKKGWSNAPNWQERFDKLMSEQRQRSQTASKGVFKGGLGGHSDIHKKYHTATHLMYAALRQVLGEHVIQRGSNITEERLRFDFSHPAKMTDEEKKKVEDLVNEQIDRDLTVSWQEYPTDQALKMGAKGQFGDKYGDKVKVYKMQKDSEEPFSFEICGGPHVDHTNQLADGGKKFKIAKEESVAAGVRRIKALLE